MGGRDGFAWQNLNLDQEWSQKAKAIQTALGECLQLQQAPDAQWLQATQLLLHGVQHDLQQNESQPQQPDAATGILADLSDEVDWDPDDYSGGDDNDGGGLNPEAVGLDLERPMTVFSFPTGGWPESDDNAPGPRIGLDQGGVLQVYGKRALMKGAIEAVKELAELAGGPHRIYIISRVNHPCRDRQLPLLERTGFFRDTGVPMDNFHVVSQTTGPHAKGPLAMRFQIRAFVDGRIENLENIEYALAGRPHLLIHFTGDPGAKSRTPAGGSSSHFPQADSWPKVVKLCRDAWPRLCERQVWQ